MRAFKNLYNIAAQRQGGPEFLEDELRLFKIQPEQQILSDDRYLAGMTRAIFLAGAGADTLDTAWDAFESLFHGFDPQKCAAIDAAELEQIQSDPRLPGPASKLESIPKNAEFVLRMSAEHGSFGKWLAAWPGDNLVGLFDELKAKGHYLGGRTAPRFLELVGKDTFILNEFVLEALRDNWIVDKMPTTQHDKRACQDAFNRWHNESQGRSYREISSVLAFSVI